MTVKFIADMPGLSSEKTNVLTGLGYIEKLPFDAWTRLDHVFIYNEKQ
jgi:hypothetical protein